MRTTAIASVRLDEDGRIRVRPIVEDEGGGYALIYRSAAWVRWDPVAGEFFVTPDKDEQDESQFARILRVLRAEYGQRLKLTSESSFDNVPPKLVAALKLLASKP